MFSQSDIDDGRVAFVHDGTTVLGGDLFLEVGDPAGALVALTLPVNVVPAPVIEPEPEPEPPLAAALLGEEIDAPGGVVESAPFTMVPTVVFEMTELPFENLDTEVNILEQNGLTEDEDSTLAETQAATIEAPEAGDIAESGNSPVTEAQETNQLDQSRGAKQQLVASLILPELPFTVDLFRQTEMFSDLTERLFEDTERDEQPEEIRNEVLVSLLELNPVEVKVNSGDWLKWQVENGGFERSLEIIEDVFQQAADEIEQDDFVSDADIGTSIGLTTGLTVWLLRGGTLLLA